MTDLQTMKAMLRRARVAFTQRKKYTTYYVGCLRTETGPCEGTTLTVDEGQRNSVVMDFDLKGKLTNMEGDGY
jgi:hypothetical protein